jgi:hypothetical protein
MNSNVKNCISAHGSHGIHGKARRRAALLSAVSVFSVCSIPFLTLALAMPAFAQGAPASTIDDDTIGTFGVEITPATERAILRGLDYLAAQQHPDGYWIETVGRKVNEEYQGRPGKHVGVTALACMAFLSNGSTPQRGRYGDNVERGLSWLLDQVKPDDGFITSDQSRMYSHAFATLFLAEVYGMTGDSRVRPKLQAAIDCIVQAQNAQGGWRYLPGSKDSDMSITVTCVMALRGARNVGIFVPRETIQRAIDYVKLSYIDSPNPEVRGGYWYQIFDQPFRHSRTSFALTAAGVTALYGAGEYDSPQIRDGLKFLFRKNSRYSYPKWRMFNSFDYFYGHYYAIQAFYQAGGEYWARWYPDIRDEIVEGQHKDGYWQDLVGRNYATAMATIILQVPYRYLPIFER